MVNLIGYIGRLQGQDMCDLNDILVFRIFLKVDGSNFNF